MQSKVSPAAAAAAACTFWMLRTQREHRPLGEPMTRLIGHREQQHYNKTKKRTDIAMSASHLILTQVNIWKSAGRPSHVMHSKVNNSIPHHITCSTQPGVGLQSAANKRLIVMRNLMKNLSVIREQHSCCCCPFCCSFSCWSSDVIYGWRTEVRCQTCLAASLLSPFNAQIQLNTSIW
jgi:hypothetical protein